MHLVGIKELKNKLTHYLRLTKKGDQIVVTERGAPIAILHSLDHIEVSAGLEERLASLAKGGNLRLPIKKGKLPNYEAVSATGKLASKIIIEERR
jgi:prevent-host-death family protein